jgi:hypothetical protein
MQESILDVNDAIVSGNWIVGTDATVLAGTISLDDDSDWEINDGLVDVAADINNLDPDSVHEFAVEDGGELFVGGDAFFHELGVRSGSSAEINGALDAVSAIFVNGATLTAASAGTTGASPSLGLFEILAGGSASIGGEFRVRQDGSNIDNLSIGSGTNLLSVGSLNFANAGSQLHATGSGSLAVTVSGDVDIAITGSPGTAPLFFSQRLALTLDGSSTQEVEVFTPDFDIDPNGVKVVWQGLTKPGTPNTYNVMPIAGLIVESGATVDLTDEHENFLRGSGDLYPHDALYVDGDINVASGATLNADFPVYYAGSRLGTGTINGTAVQVTKVCYGDFDADGDVDTGDLALFLQAFSGANNESGNPLCTADRDGDVDTVDFSSFQQQFTGANQPCPTTGGDSSSGGGEWTIESLAEWCLTYLSSAQRESFAEKLYALAEAAGETQDAADMAELADLITAA